MNNWIDFNTAGIQSAGQPDRIDPAPHIERVALELLGDPNPKLSKKTEWRYGARGSLSVDLERGTFYDHEQCTGGGVLDLIIRERGGTHNEAAQWLQGREGLPPVPRQSAPRKASLGRVVATYPYHDEAGVHLFDVVRMDPKDFRQRAASGAWGVKGIRKVLYRLPRIASAPDGATVYIVEGEKDVHKLEAAGLLATTNPGGAGKWSDDYAANLKGKRAVILPDNDKAGRDHAEAVRASLGRHGVPCGVMHLSGLPEKGDVADWLDKGNTAQQLEQLGRAALEAPTDAPKITPTPFTLRPSHEIPPRQWLYGRHLIRGFLSLTVAPGGVGKSSMVLVDALAMATGRDLLGAKPPQPLRVWVWNGEDPREEIERRITAACIQFGISGADLADRLLVDSGRDLPITLASMGGGGVTVAKPTSAALKAAIRAQKIDVLIIDPFVTSHEVSENDNTAINAVAAEWRRIADETGCAIELVHHTSKAGAADGDAHGILASRGGGALIDAVRAARYLVRMTQQEADRLGIEETEARVTFRVCTDGKANLAPPEKATWRRMVSISLGNGGGHWPEGDHVGVCTPWTPPDPFEGVTARDLRAVQKAIEALPQPPRESDKSPEWAGFTVANVLGLTVGDVSTTKADRGSVENAARGRIRRLLKDWCATGALIVEEVKDAKGNPRKIVTVGEPVRHDEC